MGKPLSGFLQTILKHQDKIRRVTLWGVTDNQSWKNDFPVKGRTDYPLAIRQKLPGKTCCRENHSINERKIIKNQK
jgi:endo-1,4-beta-xylanase